jgi:hypothetical protein
MLWLSRIMLILWEYQKQDQARPIPEGYQETIIMTSNLLDGFSDQLLKIIPLTLLNTCQ